MIKNIGISIVGLLASILIIGFMFYSGRSIWLGVVLLLCNLTILLANISKQKNKGVDE